MKIIIVQQYGRDNREALYINVEQVTFIEKSEIAYIFHFTDLSKIEIAIDNILGSAIDEIFYKN